MSTAADQPASFDPTAPTLEPMFRIVLRTAEPVQLGDTPTGSQSVSPVVGGVLSGPGIEAVVRAVGTDHVRTRLDGSGAYRMDLLADVESEDPGPIHLSLSGIRFGSVEVVDAVERGEDVDPALYYFRGTLDVSTSIRSLAYLNRAMIVTSGSQQGTQIILDAFLVT